MRYIFIRLTIYGVDAINRLNESSFDAVVTDVIRAGINGDEVAKYTRETAGGAIPVVIGITGNSSAIDLKCFDIVLQKPLFLKNLIECLRDFENKRR